MKSPLLPLSRLGSHTDGGDIKEGKKKNKKQTQLHTLLAAGSGMCRAVFGLSYTSHLAA